MTFSYLQKLLEKCILLFYQKKVPSSGFLWGIQWLMVRATLPKIRWRGGGGGADGFWTVIIPGGWYFFAHKLLYKDFISCFISLNLHFLKFNENFTFFSKFIYCFLSFFFLWNCPEVSSSAVLDMTLKGPAHDTGSWRLYEGLQGKSLFCWAGYFLSWLLRRKIDQEVGGGGNGVGSENNWGEPLVVGIKNNWRDESGFTLWSSAKFSNKRIVSDLLMSLILFLAESISFLKLILL